MSTIVVFKGSSQYGALRLFTDQVAESFNKMERNAVIIDFEDPQWANNLKQTISAGIDFIYSFNGMGSDLKLGDELLANKLNTPVVYSLVDHPIYHWSRLHAGIGQLLVTCVDREAVRFLNTSMPNAGLKGSAFVPHAGVIEETSAPVTDIDNRPISVLFCGSYQLPDYVFKNVSLPDIVRKRLFSVIDLAFSRPGEPLPKLAEELFDAENIYFDYTMWNKYYLLLQFADRYIRSYKRNELINRLIDDGIAIEVCGNGWESFPQSDRLVVHKSRAFEDVVKLMKQAKICLEIDANFSYGGHERPLTAMLNHVAVIANYNDYYNDHFVVGKELLLYSPVDRYDLTEKISKALKNSSELQQISEAGYSAVHKNHTYLHMAKQILNLVDTYRAFACVSIS